MPAESFLPVESHVDGVVIDYLEGDLSPSESERVRAHLERCPSCASLFEWTRDQRDAVLSARLRHLSSRDIAEIAQGRVATEAEAAHVAICSSCDRDLSWAKETLAGPPPGGAGPTATRAPRKWSRLWIALAAAPAAIVVVVILLLPWLRERMAYPVVSARDVSVQAPPFGTLWRESHEAAVTVTAEPRWPGPRALVYGTAGEGMYGGTVYVREYITGTVLWGRAPDDAQAAIVFGQDRVERGSMGVQSLHFGDLDGDGTDELLVVRGHHTWFPASITAHRMDGTVIGVYYNWGVIYAVRPFDLDGDGRDEILVGGTNNGKAYQGATLILLDEKHFRGASVDSRVAPNCPIRDWSRVRVVLPQFEQPFMDLLEIQRTRIREIRVSGSGAGVRIYAHVDTEQAPLIVVFDAELRPLSHEVSNALEGVTRLWPAAQRQRFLSEEYQREWFESIVRFENRGAADVRRQAP